MEILSLMAFQPICAFWTLILTRLWYSTRKTRLPSRGRKDSWILEKDRCFQRAREEKWRQEAIYLLRWTTLRNWTSPLWTYCCRNHQGKYKMLISFWIVILGCDDQICSYDWTQMWKKVRMGLSWTPNWVRNWQEVRNQIKCRKRSSKYHIQFF